MPYTSSLGLPAQRNKKKGPAVGARAESGVRDARNSFSASRARKAGIIIRQWREARKDRRTYEKTEKCKDYDGGGGGPAPSARLGIEDTLASSRGANERERRGDPVKNVAFSS